MQHYHSGRFYEPAEPPPAHRPQTSHSSLAALGSDRPLGHLGPLGTPDRPLSSHSALAAHIGGLATPERTLTTHLPPDRPLSSHSLGLGAGLGAAGNLMGAVARHVGVDAPAAQRGLQAATPPHASQVPPQAESLLMLLKVRFSASLFESTCITCSFFIAIPVNVARPLGSKERPSRSSNVFCIWQ